MCNACGKPVNTRQSLTYEQHVADCYDKRGWKAGEDYIECKLCVFSARRMTSHVRLAHGMSRSQYEEKHGPTIAPNEAKRQLESTSSEEYRKNMSEAVSRAVMSDPIERARRSALIGELNKTDAARARSSAAAKVTSSRSDVIAPRTANLRRWRNENREEFYEKCTAAMHSYRTTKPERALREHVEARYPEFGFKGNQRLMSQEYFHLTQSHKRQIDLLSRDFKIIIEIDGYLHFHNVPQWNQLETLQAKDAELNAAAPKLGYALIRIAYDQWDKNTGELSDACKSRLHEILMDPKPGVYRLGSLYPEEPR